MARRRTRCALNAFPPTAVHTDGAVNQVHVYEVQGDAVEPEEAVRILVQFERQEQALKAVIDLDGRYFGGRPLRATFFDNGRFERFDFAPREGEPL